MRPILKPQPRLPGQLEGYKQVHGYTCIALQVYLDSYRPTQLARNPVTEKALGGIQGQLLQEDNAWFHRHPMQGARLRRYVAGEFASSHDDRWVYVLVRRGIAGLVSREPASITPLQSGQDHVLLFLANEEPERVVMQVGGSTPAPRSRPRGRQRQRSREGED